MLKVNEADTDAVGLLDDETKLTVVEEVVVALGNILPEGIVGKGH